MKRLVSFLIALGLVIPLLIQSAETGKEDEYDLQELRDAVDFVLAAIGTHNPDPVMSTVLSAVPESTRGILFLNSNAKMQAITLAIDEHPEQEAELMELLNFYQAVLSAAGGDNTRLKQILSKRNGPSTTAAPQINPTGLDPGEAEAEERDSLKLQLDQISRRIQTLQEQKSSFSKLTQLGLRMDNLHKQAQSQPGLFDLHESIVKTFYEVAETFADDLRQLEQNIAVATETAQAQESRISKVISAAKEQAANCEGKKDSDFIIAAYHDARSTFAQLNDQLETVSELLVEAGEKIHRIKKANAKIEARYHKLKEDAPKQHFKTAFSQFKSVRTDWMLAIQEINHFSLQVSNLEADLNKLQDYYLKAYPDTSTLFDEYNTRIQDLKFDTRAMDINNQRHRSQFKELKSLEEKLFHQTGNYHINWPFQPVAFTPLEDLKKQMEQVENLHLAALIQIEANQALQEGCQWQTDSNADTADDTDEPDSNEENTHSGITLLDVPTNDETPTAPVADGEIYICGPSTLLADEWVEFTAVDAEDIPYSNPAVLEWTKTREDLLAVRNGSNPCLVNGFKAGSASIIVIHHGLQKSAMHSVTIQALVPNLIGMNGKEAYLLIQSLNLQTVAEPGMQELAGTEVIAQSPEAGYKASKGHPVQITVIPAEELDHENLFGTDGGEQVDVSDQDTEQGPSEDEPPEAFTEPDTCEYFREKIASALQQRNTDEALRQAAIAAASGCDLDFGAIAAIIDEINNEKLVARDDALLEQEADRVTREREAWIQHYEAEQQRFREQMEQDRQRLAEADRQREATQSLYQNMISYWYNQGFNHSRDNNGNSSPSRDNENEQPGSQPSTSDRQSYEVTYWDNGNIREERYYYDSGKIKKRLTYEKSTGYFINEKQYYPDGHLKYSMTHWHNGIDDLGIAREEFYNERGVLIRKIGYNQDGSVRKTWEK